MLKVKGYVKFNLNKYMNIKITCQEKERIMDKGAEKARKKTQSIS
jgi:hypothetical protein